MTLKTQAPLPFALPVFQSRSGSSMPCFDQPALVLYERSVCAECKKGGGASLVLAIAIAQYSVHDLYMAICMPCKHSFFRERLGQYVFELVTCTELEPREGRTASPRAHVARQKPWPPKGAAAVAQRST